MEPFIQLQEKHILLNLQAEDRLAAFNEILTELVKQGQLPEKMKDEALQTLTERETQTTFAMGKNVAIPHINGIKIPRSVFAYARSQDGIEFGSCDAGLVNHIFLALIPVEKKCGWLKTLAQMAKCMIDKELRESLLSAQTTKEAQELLTSAFKRNAKQ